MPKMKRMSPTASQRSRCLVWVNFVAPQEHGGETSPAAEVDGLIEGQVGPLVQGAHAGAVERNSGSGRVGQRNQEGVIGPGALAADRWNWTHCARRVASRKQHAVSASIIASWKNSGGCCDQNAAACG